MPPKRSHPGSLSSSAADGLSPPTAADDPSPPTAAATDGLSPPSEPHNDSAPPRVTVQDLPSHRGESPPLQHLLDGMPEETTELLEFFQGMAVGAITELSMDSMGALADALLGRLVRLRDDQFRYLAQPLKQITAVTALTDGVDYSFSLRHAWYRVLQRAGDVLADPDANHCFGGLC
jgi:hypothetical protein